MGGKRLSERTMGHAKLEMLIDYYLADMQRRGRTDDSVGTNRLALRRFARSVDPDSSGVTLLELTDEVVHGFVSALQQRNVKFEAHPNRKQEPGKLSAFTIRKEVRILKGFGTWLRQEGFENPFGGLVVPKEPKRLVSVLTDEEIDRILKSINPQTPIGSRLYAIVLLMLDSGPRISEVVGARMPDLDLETRQLRIIGKGDKERIIPFGARTGKALLSYIHVHRPSPLTATTDRVFLSMDGLPMTRNSLAGIVGRLKRASGVGRLHAHLFRHTFAVKYLMNGGDLVTLQSIMGHESLEVTKRYLSLTSAQVQLRYDSYSPVDRMALSGLRRFGDRRQVVTPTV
jgi:integrase/recombinase XerC/integrase/recombinase XerD